MGLEMGVQQWISPFSVRNDFNCSYVFLSFLIIPIITNANEIWTNTSWLLFTHVNIYKQAESLEVSFGS